MTQFDEMVQLFEQSTKAMEEYQKDCDKFATDLVADLCAYLECEPGKVRKDLIGEHPWKLDDSTETPVSRFVAMRKADKSMRMKIVIQLTPAVSIRQSVHFALTADGADVVSGEMKKTIRRRDAVELRALTVSMADELNAATRRLYGPPSTWLVTVPQESPSTMTS